MTNLYRVNYTYYNVDGTSYSSDGCSSDEYIIPAVSQKAAEHYVMVDLSENPYDEDEDEFAEFQAPVRIEFFTEIITDQELAEEQQRAEQGSLPHYAKWLADSKMGLHGIVTEMVLQ